jgi:FAD/FMN-containing dehydrogenase
MNAPFSANSTPVPLPEGFVDALVAVLGPKGVSQDAAEIAPRLSDWRGRYQGASPLLIKPASTEQVSAALALCYQADVAVTPQGGNTGLVNGGIPYGEVLISTHRMNRVRNVDALNDSLVAEAGCTLVAVQEAATEAGRLFPLSLGSEGTATLGGLLSTNAGGVNVLRYGMIRELALGLEVVLPDGRIWNGLRALRKDNTGYDLKHMFIGAEGTLGVITAASLKLFARPAAKATAWVAVETPHAAVALLGLMKAASGGAVTSFEIVPSMGVDLVVRHIPGTRDPLPNPAPWRVLVELSFGRAAGAMETLEEALAEAFEKGLVVDAALAANEAQAADFWRIRETLPEAEKEHGAAIKHDVSTPISATADFIAQASAAALRIEPKADIIAFGHVGDGNIHFNVGQPQGMDKAAFMARGPDITEAVHAIAAKYNGSISAEHGIGLMKRDELPRRKSAVEMDMMRAIKAAFDPKGLMNPGRVLKREP